MKNSIIITWKSTNRALLHGLGLFILIIALPAFGQTLNNSNLTEAQEPISFLKSSSPQGENIIISMMDANNSNKDSFIQIYNADVIGIDLTGWSLIAIVDGKENCTWELSGTIKPGESKTAGDDRNHIFTPDFINDDWNPGNNKWNGDNDGARLYKDGSLIDDGYCTTYWDQDVMLRNENVGTPTTLFDQTEWTAYTTTFDESFHNCRLPIIDIGPGLWSELTTDYTKGVSYHIIGTVEVDIADPAECYSIYIQDDNKLQINPLAALTINKNLNNYTDNSAFIIKANSSGSGSVIIHGISDNGTMEQYFEDTKLQNWQYISSPVKNAKSAIYENDYLMYYYEPQLRYVSITPSNVDLKVGRGYTVKKAQDNIEKYEGILNNGEVSIPTLTNTLGIPYSTDEHSGWNLIGNPYTSSINWDNVSLPSKVHGQVSVWVVTNNDGEYVSDWKVWVKGLGDDEAHYIDPGEGFFVFANDTEEISFDSSVQTHHVEESSTKSTPNPELDEIMEIQASGNNLNSSFYFRFLEGSNPGFDPEYDAFKMLSESEKLPQIYNKLEETILAINSIPHPAEDDVLHLAFTSGTEGTYQLDFIGIESFDYQQGFYLKDNLSGESFDLRKEKTVTFNYKTSDPENRFDLVFGLINGTNDIDENEFGTNIYQAAGNIYIKTDYPQTKDLKIEIRNLLGQTVYTSSSINDFTNGRNLNLPNATYLVSISNEAYLFTEKVAVYQ